MKKIEQHRIANDIMAYLQEQRYVNACTLHGSLAGDAYDEYSDIDIQIDVSGTDNGKIALMLPYILQKRFALRYVAFAPRFAPDLYLVSCALEQTSIFHFVDIECLATPHVPSLQKDDIRQITNWQSLCTKLLIGCLKHYIRQQDYITELHFLAHQLQVKVEGQAGEVLAACFATLHNAAPDTLKDILWQGLSIITEQNRTAS